MGAIGVEGELGVRQQQGDEDEARRGSRAKGRAEARRWSLRARGSDGGGAGWSSPRAGGREGTARGRRSRTRLDGSGSARQKEQLRQWHSPARHRRRQGSDDEPKDGEDEGAPLPGARRGTSGRKGDRGADGIGRQPRAAVEGKASSTRALLLSLPASGGARRRTKGREGIGQREVERARVR